jgi:hypothetical protein
MVRWILLLLIAGAIYWLYQNGYYDLAPPKSRIAEPVATAPPLEPGPRLGGGLNPFISDDGGGGGGPSRPPMPKIPGAR